MTKKKTIARTQYCKGYWLKWSTGRNSEVGTESNNDIKVVLEDDNGNEFGDAICNNYSYGQERGLWEIMIDTIPDYEDDSVLGYLTFKQVLKYFDKKIKKLEAKYD